MKSQGPIQLLLVMLLASLLKVKAQSSIAKTDNSEQYGIISKSTALTCTDSSAAPGSTFTFLKNNVIILTNLGEVGPSGKYSATASSGSIQMTIQDVVISDEDSYSCTVGFGAAASPYNLQVTVQPTNNTCTGPGNDYSGDLLTFTCTDLYPLPSVQSVMDGTQTIVGTNTTLKTNNLYDLQWTALASSSPKTYILAVAITTRSTYTVYLEITIKVTTTTTPHPVCDCCCCDNKPKRDGACGAVLGVCICVMAVLVICFYKGFSSNHLQGKIFKLILAIFCLIVALTGLILSAICLSKECCSCSGDSCQAKNCFKGDTIAGFVMTGLSVLGTVVVIILIFLITGQSGSGKQKTEAENENEELKGNKR